LIFGWHWLFVINLPIAAIIIAMSIRTLPGARPRRQRSFDWGGMIVLAALLASLAYGINQLDTSRVLASLASVGVWPFLLVGLLLLPVFWRIERHTTEPVLRLRLFRSRQVVLASAFAAGAGLGEAALVFVPALLVAAFGVTTSTASFMLVPAVLSMAAGSPLAGRTLDRSGSKIVVLGGNLAIAVGALLVGSFATNLIAFYIAAVLVGLGLSSLLGATLRYIMLNEAPVSDRAAAQGVLTIFTSMGQLMGGALVGAIVASRGGGVPGYAAAYLVLGMVALLLAVAALGLKGRAEELETVRRQEAADGAQSAQAARS
jgi:MFS family permease